MRLYRHTLSTLAAISALLNWSGSSLAHSGHTVWGAWTFDWEVRNDAGLGLRNLYFDGKLVAYKMSLPVIRVRYDGDQCGPYADRINWDNLVDISNCGGAKVCQESYSSGGRNWLEIGILARIGAYRLYDAYYLSHDGWITCRLWSRGLQCEVDHNHHPYWRFDFDIDGAASDQVFVYDSNRSSEGWGPGWHKYTTELNTVKNPSTNRMWFQRDSRTGDGVWVIPGPDGVSDSFAGVDVAPRRYHFAEDVAWAFGAWGEVGYLDYETIQEQDDITWYIAHLHHEEEDGEDQWHWAGPWLKVSRP